MSNLDIADFKTCLQDLPYEILYIIFCKLPEDKLIGISKLCSNFRNVVGDKRIWKDLYIGYQPNREPNWVVFDFEELYSEPWPVDAIDLSFTKINPPVSSQTDQVEDQVVKVEKLVLSVITADEVTMEAILTKYQCAELYLGHRTINCKSQVLRIEPEVFRKQTALEVLSLTGTRLKNHCQQWLAPVLDYCKNLRILDLRYTWLDNRVMLKFVKNLPASLENFFLETTCPGDSFFKLLAGSTPNLKELGLSKSPKKYPSLFKFQYLEVLQVLSWYYDISDLDCMHLIKFPALKTINITYYHSLTTFEKEIIKKLRKTLEPKGIIVTSNTEAEEWPPVNKDDFYKWPSLDGNLWVVSKAL